MSREDVAAAIFWFIVAIVFVLVARSLRAIFLDRPESEEPVAREWGAILKEVLSKRRVYVVPVMGGWMVLQMTIPGSFFRDLMTWSPYVAFYNLIWQLRRL